MKKFKALISTILFIMVILTILYLTRNVPSDKNNLPVIPILIIIFIIAIGSGSIITSFYHFMNDSKAKKQKNLDLINDLSLYPLPKILDLWEVGSFEAKESNDKKYTSIVIYINSDIISGVFISNSNLPEYKKIISEMGYKEFKKSGNSEG